MLVVSSRARLMAQGRSCKFAGPDCPFSHGVEVSLSALLPDSDNNGCEWQRGGTSSAATSPAGADDDAEAAAWLLKGSTENGFEGEAGSGRGLEMTTKEGLNPTSTSASMSKRNPVSAPDGVGDNNAHDGGGGGGGRWLASLRTGSRVLARYHDRVWYEATIEEGPPSLSGGTGRSLAVRFKGFEDDGPVLLPADSAHLAPLEAGLAGGGGRDCARRQGRGRGGWDRAGSVDSDADEASGRESSDLEDAWADAARDRGVGGHGDSDSNANDTAERFFQERVLGDRRGEAARTAGGGPGVRAAGGKGVGEPVDAYVFGDWEQHTKGFGSRMMNRMGYRRGEGLGREKQVGNDSSEVRARVHASCARGRCICCWRCRFWGESGI